MDRFLNAIDRSSRLFEAVAVCLLFTYCGLMLAEIVARGLIGKSLPYSWEYSTFSMAAVFLMASGSAIRTAVHVRVSLALEIAGEHRARQIDIAANIIALFIVTIVCLALYDAFSSSWTRGKVSPTIVKTPLAIPQGILLLGAIQLWFDFLARLIRRVTGRTHELRGMDAPATYEPPHA